MMRVRLMKSILQRLSRFLGNLTHRLWSLFRRQTLFIQCLIALPLLGAITFIFVIGNMGLALLGTAIALPAFLVGWLLTILGLVFGKAVQVIWRDGRKNNIR